MIYRGLVLCRKPGAESKHRAPFLNTRAKIRSNALQRREVKHENHALV